jgi:hypothetical protein
MSSPMSCTNLVHCSTIRQARAAESVLPHRFALPHCIKIGLPKIFLARAVVARNLEPYSSLARTAASHISVYHTFGAPVSHYRLPLRCTTFNRQTLRPLSNFLFFTKLCFYYLLYRAFVRYTGLSLFQDSFPAIPPNCI